VPLCSVEFWFQDEARVGQQGTLTRVWAEKGSRPRLIRQQQYEYAYIFGAVCPSSGESVGLVLPSSNSEAMNLHLKAISDRVLNNKHAVVIMDNAGWHHAGKLHKFDNITLMYLPPYSPELNPQEQVWRQMRELYLANRCYKDYDDIVNSACEAWNKVTENKDSIIKLTTREWLNI
jgi:transposase